MMNATPIQIITLVLIGFLLFRLFSRANRKEISPRVALLWGLLWLGTGIVVFYPGLADEAARLLGLETATGIDLVAYVAVGFLFYLMFRLWIRFDRIEQNITKIVRQIAFLTDKDQNPS